jgi:DNA-binding transcriptional LysR family regulator
MDFDLKSLELFSRIATLGAFAKAGEEQQLSPTATSQRIQTLEKQIGIKLFHRTTRAISLTPDGENFLIHARRILESVEDAKHELARSGHVISGMIRVSASLSFAINHILPHLTEFLDLYPQIDIKLDLSDTVVDLVEQGYDLAIRVGTLASSSLIAKKLVDNPRVLVASPAYLARHPAPETPSDLKKHTCILLGENRLWSLIGPDGKKYDVPVTGRLTTTFGGAVTIAARQGLGIGLKSYWDVAEDLSHHRLVRLLENFIVTPQWQVWAVRLPGPRTPRRVQVFIEFLERKLRQSDGD